VGGRWAAGNARRELARRVPWDRAAEARLAAEHHRRAIELAGGHHHPLWARMSMGYAAALRLAGDEHRALSRRTALSALRGHAWQAFAQTDTGGALAAARSAAEDARTAATWCLADLDAATGVYEELVATLDAGRTLVVRAVTGSRTIVERLEEAGRHDLAEEWRATAGQGGGPRPPARGLPAAAGC